MRRKKGVSKGAVAAIIVVVVVLGTLLYVAETRRPTVLTSQTTASTGFSTTTGSTPTQTTSSPASTLTTSASSSVAPPPPTKTSLVVEEGEQPDSLDPAVTFTTPGWEVVEQVYQGLVMPNGESVTSYVGVLAQNWTVSSNGMTYTFNLRHRVKYSNGDPFSAYDVWFSIYRTLIMNQAPAFILAQNMALGNGVNFTVNATVLNSINYEDPSQQNLSFMEYPAQSVQVVTPYQVVFHLGYGYNGPNPYNAFLATLTTPMAMPVDPRVVEQNGGVVANQTNSWMETNAVGTGFYTLQSWVQGQSVTLTKNNDYWADNLTTSQLNYAIQPPILNTVTIYYKADTARVADLKSGFAQIIEAPVSDYGVLQQIPDVNVSVLPVQFGSSEGVYYLYMDPAAFPPFQNIFVREAVSYAIDYQGIIKDVFNNEASQWIGPVPPGFPYYQQATSGLSPYHYDPLKAAQLLSQAGYRATAPNGTVLNPGGKIFPSLNFLYDSDSTSQTEVASIIESELSSIGITVTLAPLTTQQYTNVVYSSSANTSYPFGLNFYSEDYTASIDYVNALTTGDFVGTSGYYNLTIVNWTIEAATSLNNQTVVQSLANITRAMYNSYIDIWLYVPYLLSVHVDDVTGMIPNPGGSGAGYFFFYNTVHYT
jgi:peptide/nickel transport system substrate-binding protein